MDILIAIAHIAGAVITVMLLGFGVSCLQIWFYRKTHERVTREIALKIGVKVSELDEDDNAQRFWPVYAERFSSDRLQNRVSDLMGVIVKTLDILFVVAMIVLFVLLIYNTFWHKLEIAKFIWFIVGVSIFSLAITLILSLLCYLLTGRYPAEAKTARRNMKHLNVA